jgi:hypothetical protein
MSSKFTVESLVLSAAALLVTGFFTGSLAHATQLECSAAKDGGEVCLSLPADDAKSESKSDNTVSMLGASDKSEGALSLESQFDTSPVVATTSATNYEYFTKNEYSPAFAAALQSQSDLRRIETFLTNTRVSSNDFTVTTSGHK